MAFFITDRSVPRTYLWVWILRCVAWVVTLGVLGVTGSLAGTLYALDCKATPKMIFNFAAGALALILLLYSLLSSGPKPFLRFIPHSLLLQLTFDFLLFAIFIAAAATSPVTPMDLCKACASITPDFVFLDSASASCTWEGDSTTDDYYDYDYYTTDTTSDPAYDNDFSTKLKRGLASLLRRGTAQLMKRKSKSKSSSSSSSSKSSKSKSSSSSSDSSSSEDASGGFIPARIALNALMIVILLLCLSGTLLFFLKKRKETRYAPAPAHPNPNPEAQPFQPEKAEYASAPAAPAPAPLYQYEQPPPQQDYSYQPYAMSPPPPPSQGVTRRPVSGYGEQQSGHGIPRSVSPLGVPSPVYAETQQKFGDGQPQGYTMSCGEKGTTLSPSDPRVEVAELHSPDPEEQRRRGGAVEKQ